ncbi:hypothetical protein CCAX7_21560 [Capsulimonas corticalis]|uniref:Uncharacterized protein n=1 Tax=Capsulimonas corticalis TaxID=2219043 RepID=A0A402D206_9BACT|nr:DUF4440 domain-containing protein [Capsulimonas corticalis]BDI30105.1 hypothetical protein CCAX7_21560 [Capsulimonas corticalis]
MLNSFLKKPLFSLCAVAAVLLSPHTLKAAAPSADRVATETAIKVIYDDINADFNRRDLSHMMAYFTPDYTEIDEKGTRHTKEQAREGYQKQLGQITTIQSHYTIQSVTPTPAGTLVEMHLHSDGTGQKRILFAKLHGSFTSDLQVRDLWVNTPDGWRIQHRQTLQNDLKVHPR